MFTEALILQYFNSECYIRIATNVLGYFIDRMLSQLTFDQVTLDSKTVLTKSNFGQYYPIAYFSQEMIHAKT